MRTRYVAVALFGGLLAACSADVSDVTSRASTPADSKRRDIEAHDQLATAIATGRVQHASAIAHHPDRGALFTYDETAPIAKGADTWHQVALSEAHALHAVATGTMEVAAPDGTPIRLKYARSVEHGDGNWTWIGRPEGAQPGTEAIITFGERAVFGTIPYGALGLQLTTQGGKGYLVATDASILASMPRAETDADFVIPNIESGRIAPKEQSSATLRAAGIRAESAVPASVATTVDVVVGYTAGLATRLGGSAEAVTRIHQVIAVANQAYVNSQIDGSLRLVNTVQVNYTDATSNRATLFELTGVTCTNSASAANLPDTGVNCTPGTRPAALEPLATARESYGADLVVLMRNYQAEHLSCGLGWMNGGGQTGMDVGDAPFGFSVVSDSPTTANCRNESLAHETGHNMGLQHDAESAAGADMVIDPEEFGAFPYAFGYSTAVSAGNFYTVMSMRKTGQTGFLVFANPRITFCGGAVCGTFDTADNWRALTQTMRIAANFRQGMVPATGTWMRADFNADGRADLVWRNRASGANALWRSANSATSQSLTAVSNPAWQIVGAADFDGDGPADLLWRNVVTGQNTLWRSGNSAAGLSVSTVPSSWTIVGAGDFDGDNKHDLLWRDSASGRNAIWRSANSATQIPISAVGGSAWVVVGVGDFDGDARDDVLWRNTHTGANTIWRSGNAAASLAVSTLADQAWVVAGVADFNNDNRDDILWRNLETGANVIWRSGNGATVQGVTTVNNPAWVIVATGDFDGDGAADIVWRNFSSGGNTIWRSGNSATALPVTTVPAPWWIIAG